MSNNTTTSLVALLAPKGKPGPACRGRCGQWRSQLLRAVGMGSMFLTMFSVGTYGQDAAGSRAYVLGAWGQYTVLDKATLKIVGGGDFFSGGPRSAGDGQTLAEVAGLDVMRVTPDLARNRMFVLLAIPQSDKFAGYAVVQLDPPKVLRILKLDVPLANAAVIVSPSGDRIYATYWYWESPVSSSGELLSKTVVYHGETYQTVQTFVAAPFSITPWSCFLRGGVSLFTSRRLFDPLTGKELRRTKLFGKEGVREVECKAGRLLLLTADADNVITLILYDPDSDAEIRSIRTDIRARGWPAFGERFSEWRMSSDGNLIVHTEPPSRGSGAATGHTFDVTTAASITLKLPPDHGQIVGMSADGHVLFYADDTALLVVDSKSGQVTKSETLPIRPAAIVWD